MTSSDPYPVETTLSAHRNVGTNRSGPRPHRGPRYWGVCSPTYHLPSGTHVVVVFEAAIAELAAAVDALPDVADQLTTVGALKLPIQHFT